MAEELELELNEEPNINKTEERIKNLSSKVKLTAQERDELKALNETLTSEKSALEKERDFYASFSDQIAKYPHASEFKDAIKEKFSAGYTLEDATVAVLNANNRLMPQEERIEVGPIAGGSATTNLVEKPTSSLTRDEMRQKLMEADQRGDLVDVIRQMR